MNENLLNATVVWTCADFSNYRSPQLVASSCSIRRPSSVHYDAILRALRRCQCRDCRHIGVEAILPNSTPRPSFFSWTLDCSYFPGSYDNLFWSWSCRPLLIGSTTHFIYLDVVMDRDALHAAEKAGTQRSRLSTCQASTGSRHWCIARINSANVADGRPERRSEPIRRICARCRNLVSACRTPPPPQPPSRSHPRGVCFLGFHDPSSLFLRSSIPFP